MNSPSVFRVLHDLRTKTIGECKRCKLCLTRKHIVFSSGSPLAQLVVIAEAPGKTEDERGEVLVGPSGKLVDRMLETIGLDRADTYLFNTVRCFPFELLDSGWKKSRAPEKGELEACWDFFDQQMNALPNVRLILTLGAVAANRVLLADVGTYPMWKLRRKYMSAGYNDRRGNRLPMVATYHPSYLIRNPDQKIKAYQDLQLVKQFLALEDSTVIDRLPADERAPDSSYAVLKEHRTFGKPKDFQKDTYHEDLIAL